MSDRDTKISINYASGEDLYIHPIAVDGWGDIRMRSDNRIFYFTGHEFRPYQNDAILTDSEYSCPGAVRLFWYRTIKRGLVTAARWLHISWRWGFRFPWYLLKWYYEVGVPIVAASMYSGYISVQGQLSICDPDKLADTFYLNPSQKYLQQRMEEWLSEPEDVDDEDWLREVHREDRKSYFAWHTECEQRGWRIEYLCSLDT